MTALALVLAIASFGLLGLATERHRDRWRDYVRTTSLSSRGMRIYAWGGIILSFGAVVAGKGLVLGPVIWAGIVMLAAGTVFLVLNLSPRRPNPKR